VGKHHHHLDISPTISAGKRCLKMKLLQEIDSNQYDGIVELIAFSIFAALAGIIVETKEMYVAP
jgi:hypothetical protein